MVPWPLSFRPPTTRTMKYTRTLADLAFLIALAALALLPLAASAEPTHTGFTANKGQVHDQFRKPNPAVLYLLNGPGMNVQLRKDGFAYDTYRMEEPEERGTANGEWGLVNGEERSALNDVSYDFHRIDIRFVNGDPNAEIIAEGQTEDYTNHYTDVTGEAGATYVRSCSTVTYRNVWPNIDVRFNSTNEGFKYDVIVRRGGELNDARFKVEGAEVSENLKGELVFTWADGSLNELIPASWVENGRRRERVYARYRIMDGGLFGFEAQPKENGILVIDPSPIIWGTYLGGSSSDAALAVAVGEDQYSFVAGRTNSSSSIATIGAFDATYNAGGDAFLMKFTPSGTRIWGTYFGGAGYEEAKAVALGLSGHVVIGGGTASLTGIATTGAFQTVLGNSQATDGFVARFNGNGQRVWSTYYGGYLDDQVLDVRVSSAGHIGVCGSTFSPDVMGTAGTAEPGWGGGGDGFTALFTWSGARTWGTYVGDGNADVATGIAFVGTAGIVLCGYTGGTAYPFEPGIATNTAGVHDPTHNGGMDAFVIRYNMSGSKVWGTYYGGAQYDYAFDVDYVGLNKVAVCGQTSSTNGMATVGAEQSSYGGGGSDGFVAVFTVSNGTRLWGGYHGTMHSDRLLSLEGAENDHFCVGGSRYIGSGEVFVADYRNDGVLFYEPFLTSGASNCAVSATPDLLVAAGTTTYTGGFGFPGVHQTSLGGGSDGFLFRLHYSLVPLGMALQDENDAPPQLRVLVDDGMLQVVVESASHDLSMPARITILDAMGRLAHQGRMTANAATPISHLSPGTYVVMLDFEDGSGQTTRVVVP